MAFGDGRYEIGAQSGRLLIMTGRTGLGSRAGHDLTIEVNRWEGNVTLDTSDPARALVTVRVDADSMEVRDGTGGVKPLSGSDRADIRRNIREKILHTAQHPTIEFRSTHIEGLPESIRLTGELTIMGVARAVTVHGNLDDDGRVRGRATVTQSRWGITPYSAFFGALRLADDVVVSVDAMLIPSV